MAGCSWLCHLVTAPLLPYIESTPSRLAKEAEKNLLLSLSLVSREIQQRAREFNCKPEQEIVTVSLFDQHCYQQLEKTSGGEYTCLANIISALVSILSVDSQFVRHVAGIILVSMSNFLTKLGRDWVEFIHLLWISLEAAVWNISSSSGSFIHADDSLLHRHPLTDDEVPGTGDSDFNAGFVSLLQSRLVNANWLMIADLFQILRSILKSLKHDYGDLAGIFMNLAVSSLLKLPWDLFTEIYISKSFISETSCWRDDLLDGRKGLTGINDVLLGALLQLVCSLVKQNDPEDIGDGPLGDLAIYSKFTSLVPRLLSYCFSTKHLRHNKSLSRYMRHKVLSLMIRLSFHHQWQFCHPVLWTKLLRHYFEDLLYDSLSECGAGYENFLEGSPFSAALSKRDTCTRHLQRRAIFLLFKCCFSLVRGTETVQARPCTTEASSFTDELQLCTGHDCSMGLSELSEWLRKCGLLEKSVDSENYSESCNSFALSFLQLYMEEDDMFFEMLLQLLDAPFFIQSSASHQSLEEVNKDVFLLISSIFNPVHLFHMFLFLLHFDHSVLVDYLISKDTGIHCLQYLLRCLRIICKSWFEFVEFSICGSEINQPCHKRRKIIVEEDSNEKVPSLVKRQNMGRRNSGSTHKSIGLQTFEDAKGCLLSLKRSVEDLHKKDLFPYNPRPLLRSLSRFQELCVQ